MTEASSAKRTLQANYPYATVRQYGYKALFLVTPHDGPVTLYSYRTRVGRLREGTWYLTTTKYSVTTTKQLNWFARSHRAIWVEDIDCIR